MIYIFWAISYRYLVLLNILATMYYYYYLRQFPMNNDYTKLPIKVGNINILKYVDTIYILVQFYVVYFYN